MRISDWSSDVCSSDLRVCQRGVERRDRGHLAAAFGAASVARGEAGVDLDDQRAARRCGIERPDGHAARKAVEHAHARKARFADLSRAEEVAVAMWVWALRALDWKRVL